MTPWLFCFHHAGAGISSFAKWQKILGDTAEVVPVLLPGPRAARQGGADHRCHRTHGRTTGVDHSAARPALSPVRAQPRRSRRTRADPDPGGRRPAAAGPPGDRRRTAAAPAQHPAARGTPSRPRTHRPAGRLGGGAARGGRAGPFAVAAPGHPGAPRRSAPGRGTVPGQRRQGGGHPADGAGRAGRSDRAAVGGGGVGRLLGDPLPAPDAARRPLLRTRAGRAGAAAQGGP